MMLTNIKANYQSQTKQDFVYYADHKPTEKIQNDFYFSKLNQEIYPDNM